MKRFKYEIEDDIIKGEGKEVGNIPLDFIECQNTFGIDRVYYKLEGSEMTEVIGEAFNEDTARRRVDDFLAHMNVNLL